MRVMTFISLLDVMEETRGNHKLSGKDRSRGGLTKRSSFQTKKRKRHHKKELEKTRTENYELKRVVQEAKLQATTAENRSDDLEQYPKHNNIKIVGVSETDKETPDMCQSQVLKILNDKLGLEEISVQRHGSGAQTRENGVKSTSTFNIFTDIILSFYFYLKTGATRCDPVSLLDHLMCICQLCVKPKSGISFDLWCPSFNCFFPLGCGPAGADTLVLSFGENTPHLTGRDVWGGGCWRPSCTRISRDRCEV